MKNLVSLGDVVQINPRPPKQLKADPEKPVSFLPMACVFDDANAPEPEERAFKEVSKGYTYFERNDVLLAKITPCFENGKAAFLDSLPHAVGFGSTEFHVLRATSKIDPKYLFYMVWNPRFRFSGERNMTGSAGQKRVPVDFLKKYKIPLPSLEEQKRIAAILDKADGIRRKRQQAMAMADEFLRSVFLDMFGDIPAKKTKYELGTVRKFVKARSGKSSKAVLSQVQTEYPIYGGNGVNGWATEPLFKDKVLILGRVGQQCGITHMTEGPAWVTDNAITVEIVDHEKLELNYLKSAFEMSPLRATVERLDLPFINQSIILDYPMPLPPIEEQRRYSNLYDKVQQRKKGFKKESVEADDLFNSISQQVFAANS